MFIFIYVGSIITAVVVMDGVILANLIRGDRTDLALGPRYLVHLLYNFFISILFLASLFTYLWLNTSLWQLVATAVLFAVETVNEVFFEKVVKKVRNPRKFTAITYIVRLVLFLLVTFFAYKLL